MNEGWDDGVMARAMVLTTMVTRIVFMMAKRHAG